MQILVDSGVWIDHLNRTESRLAAALESHSVVTHPVVIGELVCGSIRNRTVFLAQLSKLPRAVASQFKDTLAFVESFRIHGRGLGWSDVQLLVTALDAGLTLWTRDKPLRRAALDCRVPLFTEGPP